MRGYVCARECAVRACMYTVYVCCAVLYVCCARLREGGKESRWVCVREGVGGGLGFVGVRVDVLQCVCVWYACAAVVYV